MINCLALVISDKMKKVAGIYKYTNINTGALYIGSASNIKTRHSEHLNPLPIDVAIANEGFENFKFEILQEFPLGTDKEILRQDERKWIDYYDAENNPLHYNRGYSRFQIKYDLWDAQKVIYSKRDMFKRGNDGSKPLKCFRANSPIKTKDKKTYRLPIGLFNEFISPQIIYDFCANECSTTNFKYNN